MSALIESLLVEAANQSIRIRYFGVCDAGRKDSPDDEDWAALAAVQAFLESRQGAA